MGLNKIRTPCIGVCSTGIGDDVCRGCKRYAHEVVNWNAYTAEQRGAIQARLEQLLVAVVQAKILLKDEALLKRQLHLQQIRFDEFKSPYCWIFDLLKAGSEQIDDLGQYGCHVLEEARGLSLVELKNRIDADYYTLSCVHFERYFAVPSSEIVSSEVESLELGRSEKGVE